MDLDQAQNMLLRHLADAAVPDASVVPLARKSYGWVFLYNTRVFMETGNPEAAMIGPGPVVVMDGSGEIVELGSRLPPEAAVAEFERQHGL